MDANKAHEYPFFTHRECMYFPCHEGVDPDEFLVGLKAYLETL